jgi:outer membrane protein, heavy metal efflux system
MKASFMRPNHIKEALTMRWVMAVLAFAAWLSAGRVSFAQEPLIEVDALVQEAIARNSKIQAARERHSALKEKIPQAGALEDPMLSFGVVNLPNNFDFSEEDMTQKEISVSQKFPFPGKRGLSEEAAAKEAEAVAAEVDDTANQVAKEVKTAYYDLSHAYRALDVTQRNKRILEELAKITQTRYALGQSIQEDIIRIQVEISKMLDDLIMLEQKKRALKARLNYLLNRPPISPLGQPGEVHFRPVAFSIEDLQQQAIADNPMLKALKQDIAARSKNVELAKKDYLPDFSFKLGYGQREDRLDMYSGMVEMNLPIFIQSKQDRKVAEGYAEVRSAQAKYDGAQNEILYMIADMGSMVQRLERKIELYRTGIIPQSRLQIDTAQSAYMVNKADFMTLLDSRMRLYRFELDYHDALTEYEKSLAALEAAVGTRFPREVLK